MGNKLLDNQDTQCLTVMDDRHTKKGVVLLLPSFREITIAISHAGR